MYRLATIHLDTDGRTDGQMIVSCLPTADHTACVKLR